MPLPAYHFHTPIITAVPQPPPRTSWPPLINSWNYSFQTTNAWAVAFPVRNTKCQHGLKQGQGLFFMTLLHIGSTPKIRQQAHVKFQTPPLGPETFTTQQPTRLLL